MHILKCGDPDELNELSFTVCKNHFGALQTIELEDGGTMKNVTMDNRINYVYQICHWYLTGNVHCTVVYKVLLFLYAILMYVSCKH